MTASTPSDSALVAAVATGSEAALAELYDRHADSVHAAALRLLGDRQAAEDIVQEAFLILWNRADRFDPAMGSLAALAVAGAGVVLVALVEDLTRLALVASERSLLGALHDALRLCLEEGV